MGGLLVGLAACDNAPANPTPAPLAPVPLKAGEKLRVIATTTIVGDVVRQVGGDAIALTVLLPAGTDPHTFEATPRDVAAISQAHVVIANGAGLEEFLGKLIQNAGGNVPVVQASEGIPLRQLTESERENPDQGNDPHTWFSPANVITWTHNIARALGVLDPANRDAYTANAAAYERSLNELDAWIKAEVETIPPARRKLVTDHRTFGYFADRYGFQVVGTVIASFSTAAEPSAQEIARLEEQVRREQVPAIFVGTTANPNLAQRIARDTGIRLVVLYDGSLSAPGGEADTYLKFMRYDVTAIVTALR
jgi:ABC-type Zn uptake system ZnuABC Zn-binding protein ZnuA